MQIDEAKRLLALAKEGLHQQNAVDIEQSNKRVEALQDQTIALLEHHQRVLAKKNVSTSYLRLESITILCNLGLLIGVGENAGRD